MTRTLFIDLASHRGCIAAVETGRTVSVAEVDHRIGDAAVLPLIDRMLADAGWSVGNVQRIACATGPGGFTSLRVAITLANTLADQLRVPIAGVHLSEVYRGRVMASIPRPPLWLHSTRKTHLFAQGGQWTEPTLVVFEDLARDLSAGSLWMGELIPEHREIVDAAGCTEALLMSLPDALPALVASLDYGTASIVPWYGRGW